MRPIINITMAADNTQLTHISTSRSVNISNANKIFIPGNTNKVKGFQLSSASDIVSTLSGEYTYFGPNGYSGYVSYSISENSDSNVSINFYIRNNVPKVLYLVFDITANEYATKFYVTNMRTGNTLRVLNNKNVVALIDVSTLGTTPGDQLQLVMQRWSASSKSFKVTQISSALSLTLTDATLLEFTCSENLMDSEMNLSTGVCEQYASITFYDKGNVIRNIALAGLLREDAAIDISVIHDNITYSLGSYLAETWDVASDSTTVTVECRDKSYLFDKINIEKSSLAERTLDDLLNILFDQANINWAYLDTATQQRCTNISIENCWYAASNLLTLLDKICALGMLRMYWYLDTFMVGRCI